MNKSVASRSLLTPVALAIIGYLTAIAVIGNIAGEFPINDDWAYVLPVEWAQRWGVVRFTNWQYMTLIGQTILGWLWTAMFGFSYLALRILTLIVAAGGLIALFLLARRAIGNERLAALLVLGWAVNPVFLASAASFMTDIYFWSAATGAIYLLFIGLERERTGFLIAGWTMTLFAMAIRQMAIAIPIGFFAADLARNGWSSRPIRRALPPFLLLIAFLVAYTHIVRNTIGLPTQYPLPARQLAAVLRDILGLHPKALVPILRGSATGALYLGAFGIPLALVLAACSPALRNPLTWIVAGGGFALVLVTRMPIPLAGNTLQTWGIGPRTLLDMPTPDRAGGLAYLFSALACCSLGVLAGDVVAASPRDGNELRAKLRRHWMSCGLIVTAAIGYAPLIFVYGPWFDRHMLMAAPLLLVAFAEITRPVGPIPRLAWIVVGLSGVASILMIHDYFAWQRVRWTLAERDSRAYHLPPLAIDAGFEYNNLIRHPERPSTAPMPAPLLGTPDYARCYISAGPIAGVHRLDVIDVDRWLPLGSPSLRFSCRR
jgi:hypothetical protein